MCSEIFAQGTLMLRVVIQISMLVAIPLMAACLYLWVGLAPWYICYVVLFNMLVGPVFSAGSVTSERERQTLDLLLTTILSPGQFLWAKLVAGLRVSSVLTMFLLWPLLLACVMVSYFWTNLPIVLAYVVIVLATCLLTASAALLFSVVCRKTSVSLMSTYLFILFLFVTPPAAGFFAETFFPDTQAGAWIAQASFTSPFSVALHLPIDEGKRDAATANWPLFFSFLGFCVVFESALAGAVMWLFNTRWRVSG
jgi:ABC-type transport system involved in multi-copper enzyme maturation permease subunit